MIRVWRNGVLVQRMCLAKQNTFYYLPPIYLTEYESGMPCGKIMLALPKFWYWHPSGNLDAQICDAHAEIAMYGRGYLSERARLAMGEDRNSRRNADGHL